MEPKTLTKPTKPSAAVNAASKDLVRIAEEKFATGGEEYNCLCDIAHELDQLYLKASALESRAQQLEAKLYAIALVMRP